MIVEQSLRHRLATAVINGDTLSVRFKSFLIASFVFPSVYVTQHFYVCRLLKDMLFLCAGTFVYVHRIFQKLLDGFRDILPHSRLLCIHRGTV